MSWRFYFVAVAYSELQGYGFRPYEFLPPASGPNVTSARMQESMLGMYAMRSFIYPRILTGVGYIALLLGYNSSLFVVRINIAIVNMLKKEQRKFLKIAEIIIYIK